MDQLHARPESDGGNLSYDDVEWVPDVSPGEVPGVRLIPVKR